MPAITLQQLPQDCFISIRDNGGHNFTVYYSDQNKQPYTRTKDDLHNKSKKLGVLSFEKSRENKSGLIYEIVDVEASEGFGPLLYDVAMELVNKITNGKGYLKSDPRAVSKHARNVWDIYFKRNDVVKKPLDSLKNEITPTQLDNVDLSAAKEIYGEKPKQDGAHQPWFNKPLSNGFTKPIQLLNSEKVLFGESKQKIEFVINESRREIKVNEGSNIITKHIVASLKSILPLIKQRVQTRNFNKIVFNKNTNPNKYMFEILQKIGIKDVFVTVRFEPMKSSSLLVVGGAKYLIDKKEVDIEIFYNLNGRFTDLLKEMDLFVKHIKERVTHELVHGEQFKKDPNLAKNRESYLNRGLSYENVFIDYRNKYLQDYEVQAYAKGLMKYYKWPDIFYSEWNKLFTETLGYCEYLINIFNASIGTPHYVLYFEHSISLLIDLILKFKQEILIYLDKHYRDVKIDPSRDRVTRDNLVAFVEKNYVKGILGPEPPKAPAPGKRKLEID